VAPLAEAERKWYLTARGLMDFEAADFQKWLDTCKLRRSKNENDVDFGRRVYQVIFDTGQYEAKGMNDRSASAVSKSKKSDCGGFSYLFVAAMRANGIPARSLMGRWAQSSKPGEMAGDIPFSMQHTRAEFFAEGVGWVPVDPTLAMGYRNLDWVVRNAFGVDAGDFFVQQVDLELTIDTLVDGKQTLPWLFCYGTGAGDGNRDGVDWKDSLQVREIR
jgi:hypothetical protein